MNKKVTRIIILQIASVTMLSSCTKISEDYSVYDESHESTESVTESRHIVIEDVPEETTSEEEKLTAEDFFEVFDSADSKSGRIADNMDLAVESLPDETVCKELTLSNITESDNENVLYRFTVENCEGLLISDSDTGNMYAFAYMLDDETEAAVIIGSSMYSTLSEADKYISTCESVDYLAYLSESDGKYMLLPIAAGNSECGIYGVIPNAKYMGYDMTDTDEFKGIPNSLMLSVTGVQNSEEGQEVYFYLDSRFDEEIYFSVSDIYVNGENVTDKISADDNQITLEKAGSIAFSENVLKSDDALYLTGEIHSAVNDDIISECSLALIAKDIDISESTEDTVVENAAT